MATVSSLLPGDHVDLMGTGAIYVAQTDHPLYPGLRLVVWKLDSGEWSHDALSAAQYVGEIDVHADRAANLRAALTPGGAS
jgi:hypothetical protein